MPPIVLTFAASDPTGGAGMQADLLTLAALGCHPLSVLTGVTVQDTRGVQELEPLASALVERQARALLAAIAVAAFKCGVLASAENVRAVAGVLDAMLDALVPLATVATPNTLEETRLGGTQQLLSRGCRYVLVTGTHASGAEVVNRLYDANGQVREDRWRRLPESYHGSGCTLASAIAAALAKGRAVPDAVAEAQDYTWRTLEAAFRSGAGQPVPNRFFTR